MIKSGHSERHRARRQYPDRGQAHPDTDHKSVAWSIPGSNKVVELGNVGGVLGNFEDDIRRGVHGEPQKRRALAVSNIFGEPSESKQ